VFYRGKQNVALPNQLKVSEPPSKGCVTDITYLRTYEGWLYLEVVLDLYARKVVG